MTALATFNGFDVLAIGIILSGIGVVAFARRRAREQSEDDEAELEVSKAQENWAWPPRNYKRGA